MACVTYAEKASLSTAKAPPAGTLVAAAACIVSEPSNRISALSRPQALSSASDLSELLHTNSANLSLWCAGVLLSGLISYKRTRQPRAAAAQAASTPARPAPITLISGCVMLCSCFTIVTTLTAA